MYPFEWVALGTVNLFQVRSPAHLTRVLNAVATCVFRARVRVVVAYRKRGNIPSCFPTEFGSSVRVRFGFGSLGFGVRFGSALYKSRNHRTTEP